MKEWIVYQSAGPGQTVGQVVARFAFRGMAQKLADRLNEQSPVAVRYSIRQENQ